MPDNADRTSHDHSPHLAAAADHDLLTADEERRLIRLAQMEHCRAKNARRRSRKEGRRKRLTRPSTASMDALIASNCRFMLKMAAKYRSWGASCGFTLGDLFGEAVIGFRKGVLRFDLSKEVRLTTYASWWIRHAIMRALQDGGHAIRVPVNVQHSRHKADVAARWLAAKHGGTPTVEEIAHRAGLPVEKVRTALEAPIDPLSLDAAITGDDGSTLMPLDVFVDSRVEPWDPVEDLGNETLRRRLQAALAELSPLERAILRQRYEDDRTLVETARGLAPEFKKGKVLSRERIRQIQNAALEKLRQSLADLAPPS